ncbi:ArsR family transcriptional regulator [Rhodococcus opacus M213]|uniref:ArsR family transcriptional regulator n=2 Tax=Rhodococcus opacus TaxID=37919 RepID=K8XTQ7_RHOOP|nr:ArsR family transcriptional regulator [Rhodococcus opacus M213]
MHAFDVLGDPVRRRILELIAADEKTSGAVSDVIRAEFGISQPAVSQHLKVLRENGFATIRTDGPRRLYAVKAEPLRDIDVARPVPAFLDAAARRAGHRDRAGDARNDCPARTDETRAGESMDPKASEAWSTTDEGKEFITASSKKWRNASIAFGTPEGAATAAGVRTTAFYTGADTGAG